MAQELIEQDVSQTQWHAERLKGIGASEAHNLFPVLNLEDPSEQGSRYGCPRRLSYEKLSITPDYNHSPETLRLFERGHAMEEVAADRYAEKTGVRLFRSGKSWTSQTYPFMRCFIDQRVKNEEIGDTIIRSVLECKSANEHVAVKMQQEGLPIAYAIQVAHAIECTRSDLGAF